jgi:hypothetical protein
MPRNTTTDMLKAVKPHMLHHFLLRDIAGGGMGKLEPGETWLRRIPVRRGIAVHKE